MDYASNDDSGLALVASMTNRAVIGREGAEEVNLRGYRSSFESGRATFPKEPAPEAMPRRGKPAPSLNQTFESTLRSKRLSDQSELLVRIARDLARKETSEAGKNDLRIDLGVLGGEVRSQLMVCWDARSSREPAFAELTNSIQLAIKRRPFEDFSTDQLYAISVGLTSLSQPSTDQGMVESVVGQMLEAGLTPFDAVFGVEDKM